MEAKMTAAESKRKGLERRLRVRPALKYLLLGGRRKSARRAKDKNAFIYVDRYSPHLMVLIVLLMILSLADGIFTLHLIARGATETNPVMAYLLDIGPWPFMAAKFFLSCLAILIFLVFHNFYFSLLRIHVKLSSSFL
jgi:hypothetical protein